MHVAQVGAVLAFLLRRADAEEVHIGELGRGFVVGGERQPTGGEVVPQHVSRTGLVEQDLSGGEFGDLARIDVDADHLVAQLGHAGRVGGSEITGTEDGAPHTALICGRDELTATRH